MRAPSARIILPGLVPRILLEDTHLLVLAKPAGLLSQGEHTGEPNLVDWLREYLGRPYVGLIHRLDRNTSGLLVVAKRTKSAQRLSEQLRDGKLTRDYRAWLVGRLESPAVWEHLLLKDPRTNESRLDPRGRQATLRVAPAGYGSWQGLELTLAEFTLETGRSHQIRIQAKTSGFPLLGDRKYGEPGAAASFGRPALHSFRLSFEHPMSRERLSFEDPLPEDMRGIAVIPLTPPAGSSP